MDLEKVAIMRLREGAEISKYYYNKPLLLCYSGGKDSEIILDLALKSGIDFEISHSHTTADAPETVYHIRRKFKELESKGIKCTTQMPTFKGKSVSMWSLIPAKKIPPTRHARYCCAILKETAGHNRAIVTGVRRAESTNRAKSGIIQTWSKDISKRIIINNDNDEKRKIVEGHYDNYCKHYNGKKFVFTDFFKDRCGKYYNEVVYEIIFNRSESK